MASTNQAASAESLQHQTPSLENLLARSKIFDDQIPEVVVDEQMPSLEDSKIVGMLLSRKMRCFLNLSEASLAHHIFCLHT